MKTVSIIIVSYNTRDLLLDCLRSIYALDDGFEKEVFVVDNASADGSAEAVRQTFPQVRLRASGENLGFSKANNLALAQCTGDYVLVLNPDTVVEGDVFPKMADYLDSHPDVGVVSCKLVMADGSLDLACRRSFPSLWDGFCRASGLSALFPGSSLFARYNLTYLDENETYEVDSVVGAFMFIRRQALDEVGLLDEKFFMYGEDLDWCYRFEHAGWKVVYHPAATVLHLKGRSSDQCTERMIPVSFESMETFCRKHYFPHYGPIRRMLFLACLRAWKWTTLFRNTLRHRKRTRP